MIEFDSLNPESESELPLKEAQKVFEQLVEDYYQPAYRFALSLCGNHHDACDVTQQAFYLAHTRGHQLRDPTKCKQWLFTILHREFLRIRRPLMAHPQSNLEICEMELPSVHVDYETVLDSKIVVQMLSTLEDDFRAPVALFYLRELSYREIAVVLEVPIGTVMSRLSRGKEMLRRRLDKALVEGADKSGL